MKPASVKDIKAALSILSPKELMDICLKMAAFDKENKALLTYILFEHDDQALFINKVKEEVDQIFAQASSNFYFAKKTYRKALRTANNYIRFSKNKTTEIELLIHFCQRLNSTGQPIHDHPVTENLYNRQMAKIEKAMATLHEDLQYDYGIILEKLRR